MSDKKKLVEIEETRLTYAEDTAALREPRVVCSLGLVGAAL